jgi:predicted O-linked N-acetylglucosamine transferase (SPINDLY family)
MDKGKEILKQVIKDVQNTKAVFLKPKGLMEKSIENDAQYLLALGEFIQNAQKEIMKLRNSGKNYEASKIQVEVLEAVGKYQANEGIVNEKQTHYEKVFLPMYNDQLAESNEKFEQLYADCKEIITSNNGKEDLNDEIKRLLGFIIKEVKVYEDYPEKEEEFQNHTYKIFKRLMSNYKEALARV